jgi:hypothetical protein
MTMANSLVGATRMVTSLDDSGPGSLREQVANADSGDTISFAVSGTIVLTNGELLINKNLRISGPGATNLAISAASLSRVVEILPHTTISISGLTICDGHAPDGTVGTSNNPAGGDGAHGGGIYNAGSLTITQCVVSNCVAGVGGPGRVIGGLSGSSSDGTNWFGGVGGCGGGIYNAGKLSLTGSTFVLNSSGAGGVAGGVGPYTTPGRAGGGGGAIYNTGAMTLTACHFQHNAAGNGSSASPGFTLGTYQGGLPGGSGGSGGALCDVGKTITSLSDCEFSFNASGAGAMGSWYPGFSLPDYGGDGGAGGGGGAIWAGNSLRMDGCTFLSNQTGPGGSGGFGGTNGGAGAAGGPGGAICAMGQLRMIQCSCTSNHTGMGGNGERSLNRAGSGGSGGSGGAVYVSSSLRLNGCTFRGNWAGAGGQGGSTVDTIYGVPLAGTGGSGGSGGALYCESKLSAVECTFDGNSAGNAAGSGHQDYWDGLSGQPTSYSSSGGQGGGIFGVGPLVLQACTITGNRGGDGSDADWSFASGKTAALISENVLNTNPHPNIHAYFRQGAPGGVGGTGGIHSENNLKMVLCTLSANTGGAGGGGGASYAFMAYRAGASGGAGGAAAVNCVSSNGLVLIACTIAGNRGGSGGFGGSGSSLPDSSGRTGQGFGGVGGVGGIAAESARIINTIVASNFGGVGGASGPYYWSSGTAGPSDVQGMFNSLGNNLIGQADGSTGFSNGVNGDLAGSTNAPIDPLLGPLADNGGPTFTMALLHGSPALEAGNDAVLRPPYALKNDQRGFARRSGSHVDIGAFEFQFQGGNNHAPVLSGVSLPDGLVSKVADSAASIASPGFQVSFSNDIAGATFTILATTNCSLPLENWDVLGQPLQIAPGLFQFTDDQAANNPQRFYRVSAP